METAQKTVTTLDEHIVEIISDSGEGAQRCGQSLGSIAARMGNGIWTVEIIPAEIRPPARSVAGASGNRIRIGAGPVTNGGDETDLVVAFNEQVLLGRVRAGELKPGCIILLESMWAGDRDPRIARSYAETRDRLVADGYRVIEIPMERECLKLVRDARKGKNMFVLGMLVNLYSLDMGLAREQIALTFGKKEKSIIDINVKLLEAGFAWAEANLDFGFRIPATRAREPQIVVNGNTAIALGVLASGMEICAMYPITPATSASHYLSDVFEKVGGMVHQAEDEIAACAFALGASYAGKCAVTITSGPGYSLKQEGIGLAVMAEIPMVVVNVQRGGPSTGQPTKAEQGDLLHTDFCTIRDLVELAGYERDEPLHVLLLVMLLALDEGSLCVPATAPAVTRPPASRGLTPASNCHASSGSRSPTTSVGGLARISSLVIVNFARSLNCPSLAEPSTAATRQR